MAQRERFLQVFYNVIVPDILEYAIDNGIPTDAVSWFKSSLEYNTPHGKLNRGLSVIDTAELIIGPGKSLDDELYTKAAVLGWSIELLQAYFLVADDMMDQSETRRGQLCWYLKPGVGNIAINDSFMINSSIYHLLKKHFRNEPYYIDIFELFHETTFQTELGQLLDLITAPEDHVELSKFSMDKQTFIITYKTAFYSFYLPVALAMYLTGVSDSKDLEQAKHILLDMGRYFQIQDDYLDCFGDPKVIGKIGTDIKDNKCSWLINKALEKADSRQRQILDDNYGKKDNDAEAKVKEVFNELELQKDYFNYEDSVVVKLRASIDQIDESRGFKKKVLESFLKKIYKRQK